MKKIYILLAAMIFGAFFSSNAQLTVSMSESNAQMGMRVTSIMTGITPGNKLVRNIRVYDNLAHTATVTGLRDTVIATSSTITRMDSLHTSVPYPLPYYISDTVTELDSSGAIVATAYAVNDTGVRLTPMFVKPTQSETGQKADTEYAYFNGKFTSGFDDAVMTVVVSYGDTTFSSPLRSHPAVTDTIEPVLGTTNQMVSRSVIIPIGVNNFPYSYRIYIKNSKGIDSSAIFKGRTHGGITSGVWDPVGMFPGYVSIYDMNGRTVYSEHVANVLGIDKANKYVPSTGMYIFCVKTETGILWKQEKRWIAKE